VGEIDVARAVEISNSWDGDEVPGLGVDVSVEELEVDAKAIGDKGTDVVDTAGDDVGSGDGGWPLDEAGVPELLLVALEMVN
jgi:hypothetical protein